MVHEMFETLKRGCYGKKECGNPSVLISEVAGQVESQRAS